MTALFFDAHKRAQVEREQQQLPLSYFEGTLPVPQGWDQPSRAYLALGETHATERDETARRRWPVTTLPGTHLHLSAGRQRAKELTRGAKLTAPPHNMVRQEQPSEVAIPPPAATMSGSRFPSTGPSSWATTALRPRHVALREPRHLPLKVTSGAFHAC